MREVKKVLACTVCDTLHTRPRLAPHQKAVCRVCGSTLRHHSQLDRARTIPLVLGCVLLFVIANVFPIVTLDMQGVAQPLTAIGAVQVLLQEGMIPVAMMVLLPALLLPALYLLALLGTLLVIRLRLMPDKLLNRMVRLMQQLRPWSMVEVFLLGILVAIIKLSSAAALVTGPALWAWMATTIVLTVLMTIDLRRMIRREPRLPSGRGAVAGGGGSSSVRPDGTDMSAVATRDRRRVPAAGPVRDAVAQTGEVAGDMAVPAQGGDGVPMTRQDGAAVSHDGGPARAVATGSSAHHASGEVLLPTARSTGCIACLHCNTVWAAAREGQSCARCGARLTSRRSRGLGVTWALLLTAAILYIPANLLPVMVTDSLLGGGEDTILSGVVFFWMAGEWFIASIIFIASFLIPLFKLTALFMLALQVQRGSAWRLPERTRLYHAVEWVGRWSMLDVFVVAVTSALIQRPGVAVVVAGPGIAAFGAVVVLTMLATMSFDPRLAWDARMPSPSRAGRGVARRVTSPS